MKRYVRTFSVVTIIFILMGIFSPVSTLAKESAQKQQNTVDTTIKLDPSYQHDAFDGWGTALVWFANVTGGWPDQIRNKLADALFDESGLNLNIARYNIGGEDSPETEEYMRPGGAVPGYWNRPAEYDPPENAGEDWQEQEDWWDPENPNHWDWNKDSNQQWWLEAAQERGADTFEAFSNSAPYFMTKSGYTSGNENSSEDNLQEDQYQNFATYLTKVVKYFAEEKNIQFQTLSPVNEPNTDYWGAGNRQEGSHWDPASQAKIINEVSKQLEPLNLNTQVAAMDETNPQKFRQNWDQYDQTTRNNIDQLNVHTYWPAERNAARDVAKSADKRLWMSEVDLGPSGIPQDFDNIEPGLALSERITSDITNLESKAWVLWQAIEDQENMNAENENMNWGLIHADFTPDNFDTLEWHKNKKYYTMANYTKFIRPGDHVINNDNENTLASINASKKQAVVVYTNTSDTEKNIDIDLSGFKQVDPSATATPHVTSASANLQQGEEIEIEDEKLTTRVEPKSVTTFVINGVAGVDQAENYIKPEQSYHIENVNSEKVLDLSDSSVVQFSKDRDRTTQQWQLQKVTDGYTSKELYRIKNLAGDQVLTHNDGTVTLAPFQNLDAQKWMLSTSGNDIYTFINKESGTLLEVGDQSTNEGASVGVWKATSGANQQWTITESGIEKVEDVKVWTSVGTEPALPETVHVYYSDETEDDVSVNWESIDDYQYQSERMFKVEGEISNSANIATATVYVSDIKELEVLKQKTVKGNAPNLPDTVTATLTNGEKVDVAVNWNEVDSDVYAEFGKFTVKGVIEGSNMQAIAYIQVVKGGLENVALNESDQPFPKASASFTGQWDDVNQLNDGDYSDARWTNWDPNEWREKDWVEIDFGNEKLLSHVTLSFYDDEGGTRPPESLYLEYWNGNEWTKIDGSDLNVEAENDITIDFEEITTSKIRAQLTAMADTCIAIREMEVYGTGDIPVVGDQTTLDNIWVNEQPLENFESTNYNYEMELEQGEEMPVIEVETSDLLATYETVLPESVPGEAKIIVTAENGEDTATYTIDITEKEPEPTNPEDDSEEGDGDDSTDDSDQEKTVNYEINLSEKENLIYTEVEAGQTYKIQGSKSRIKMPSDLPAGTKLAIYEKDIMETNHAGLQKSGDGYTFAFKYPEGAESPDKNFQLTLEYDEKVEGDKDIYYYNKESDQWKAQAAEADKSEQTLTVMVSHFSSYAVLVKTSVEENMDNEENASNNNLPNTATNQFNLLFAGLCLLVIGIFAWRDRRSRMK